YDNQWILIAVTVDYNSRNAKFYRNGVLVYTYNNMITPLFPDSSRIKYIGSYYSSMYFMKGYLDDVRIYNRGLSANEISEIYNKTKSKYQ
ncbi:MAG: LamG domain-containing protein, partial [Candidatus Paceibacterota bacterium]